MSVSVTDKEGRGESSRLEAALEAVVGKSATDPELQWRSSRAEGEVPQSGGFAILRAGLWGRLGDDAASFPPVSLWPSELCAAARKAPSPGEERDGPEVPSCSVGLDSKGCRPAEPCLGCGCLSSLAALAETPGTEQ